MKYIANAMKCGTQSRSNSLILNTIFKIADLDPKLKTWADLVWKLQCVPVIRNGKIVRKNRPYCRYFGLNLKYLGWPYREYIKIAKNGDFCEELLSENDFEAVSSTFCYSEYGANASEAVQKIATYQKDYQKCSSCDIVCWIAKIY